MAPLRDTDALNPVTTQQGYSSDSLLANVIHASLKTSDLPKPRNTPATKLGNVCGSLRSRDRPAVQKTERSKGATPKAAALSTRELQAQTTENHLRIKPKNLLPHSVASRQGLQ